MLIMSTWWCCQHWIELRVSHSIKISKSPSEHGVLSISLTSSHCVLWTFQRDSNFQLQHRRAFWGKKCCPSRSTHLFLRTSLPDHLFPKVSRMLLAGGTSTAPTPWVPWCFLKLFLSLICVIFLHLVLMLWMWATGHMMLRDMRVSLEMLTPRFS